MDRQPKTIAVTGANGYIGAHVVRAALDLGHQVVAVSRHADAIDGRARFVEADVLARADDPQLFDDLGRPDACIHLAYRNGFVHNAPSHLEDLPRHLAFCLNMAQAGIQNLAVMGSMHEVGYWEGAITPQTPCAPTSLYGIAKNALRQALLDVYASKFPQTDIHWLRAYYIYGDDARASSIFSKMLAKAAEGATRFPFTSGVNQYDFIHVDDLATQIVCAALTHADSAMVSCCTGRPVALRDQALAFIEEHQLNLELDYGVFPDRPYDSPVVFGDAHAIRSILEETLACADFAGRDRVCRALETLGTIHEEAIR